MMGQSKQEDVLQALLELALFVKEGNSLSIETIVEDYGVKASAASKWVDRLGKVIKLREDKEGRTKVWVLDTNAVDNDPNLLHEALALRIARTALRDWRGSEVWKALDRLCDQASNKLAPRSREHLLRLSDRIRLIGQQRTRNRDAQAHLDLILRSLTEMRAVRFEYRSEKGEDKVHEVDPMRLILHADGIALYGFKALPEGRRARTYVVDRIRELSLLERQVAVGLEDEDPWRHSFGLFSGENRGDPIELQFVAHGRAAERLRSRSWHDSQRVADRADGSLDVRLTVYDCPDLRSFLWSLMPEIDGIRPPTLLASLVEEMEAWKDRNGSV